MKVVNTVMIVSVEEAQRRWDELLDYVATDYEQVLIRSETAQAVLVSAKTTTQRRTGECPQLPETQAAMSAPAES
ncbi:MAG: hypothetical protein P4L48_23250 [Mycobacterium sp.]|nr:hypothetical protein [Mycobacterium sp.]